MPVAAALIVGMASLSAQERSAAPRTLTLAEALALAEPTSEQIGIAGAAVKRAQGGEIRARSERLPQVSGAASYDRALKSEFSGLFDSTGSDCDPLKPDPSASIDARVAELERAYGCQSSGLFGGSGASGDDGDVTLPFGQANTYRVDFSVSQLLYSGGRVAAQERQAGLARSNAELNLSSARAEVALDVTQAFYDAALSDRLVAIAEASYEQADRTYQQTRTQRQAGRQSEFEELRAQVARDTIRPDIIRGRATRDIAYLRLKQLLEIPEETPLQLVVDLGDPTLPPPEPFAKDLADLTVAPQAPSRLVIDQAANDVAAREEAVTVARAQRRPSVSVSSAYGLVAYPTWFPAPGDFRSNWTVGASVSMPIFTGGRVRGEELIAQADTEDARERLQQVREFASLDFSRARQELTASVAAWEATAGTIDQARRAYAIAELRYREGISTQLELSDARLLLEQAEANRAQAARDLQIARARLALLPRLPLQAATAQTQNQSRAQATAAAAQASGATQGGAAATTGQRQQR